MSHQDRRPPGKLVFTYRGMPVDLSEDGACLEIRGTLKSAWAILAFTSGVAAIATLALRGWIVAIFGLFCGLFLVAYSRTSYTYVFNNTGRYIDYARDLFGIATRFTFCHFDEIHCVTVRPCLHRTGVGPWWDYAVAIVTKQGKVLEVSDGRKDDLPGANEDAKALAAHLGVNFIPGPVDGYLTVSLDPTTGAPVVEFPAEHINWKAILIACIGFGLLSLAVAVVMFLL